ncbi:hypothetical protein AABB24_035194 [Solanum stoloniferum]|uniref:Uncharacterized protein n=1 Tax=Solanum stoloniferum TaxID=62892 RepID=A0ABD2R6E9_9SOLN
MWKSGFCYFVFSIVAVFFLCLNLFFLVIPLLVWLIECRRLSSLLFSLSLSPDSHAVLSLFMLSSLHNEGRISRLVSMEVVVTLFIICLVQQLVSAFSNTMESFII